MGMKQWEQWHEGMQANQMQVEKCSGSCEGRNGNPKTGRNEMPLRTFLLDHEGQSFLRNRRQKGEKILT
jgi:hypothetical protein